MTAGANNGLAQVREVADTASNEVADLLEKLKAELKLVITLETT